MCLQTRGGILKNTSDESKFWLKFLASHIARNGNVGQNLELSILRTPSKTVLYLNMINYSNSCINNYPYQ